MNKRKRLILSLVPILLLTLGASNAVADTFSLTQANNTTALGTANPYGQVILTQDGTNQVEIQVELATNYWLVNSGISWNWSGAAAAPALTLVCSATGTSLCTTGTATGYDSIVPNPGSQQRDGFGTFNYSLGPGGSFGGGNVTQNLTFVVSAAGLTVSDLEGFSGGGNGGYHFAAEVGFATSSTGCNAGGPNPCTGFVATPEPKLLISLAIGMLGLALFQARRRTNAIINN